jgi:hypothetical protein
MAPRPGILAYVVYACAKQYSEHGRSARSRSSRQARSRRCGDLQAGNRHSSIASAAATALAGLLHEYELAVSRFAPFAAPGDRECATSTWRKPGEVARRRHRSRSAAVDRARQCLANPNFRHAPLLMASERVLRPGARAERAHGGAEERLCDVEPRMDGNAAHIPCHRLRDVVNGTPTGVLQPDRHARRTRGSRRQPSERRTRTVDLLPVESE